MVINPKSIKMTFEEKVRAMTGAEIILAMVKGLKNPKVKVDMYSYGCYRVEKFFFGLFSRKVCFGCAATNTICQISGKTFSSADIEDYLCKAEKVNSGTHFLGLFESAIDSLRTGDIKGYNEHARKIGISLIVLTVELSFLGDNHTLEELKLFEYLANSQEEVIKEGVSYV